MPAAVMGDMCTCVGPPDTIVLGSVGVYIGGKPAARMGDMCVHGGAITVGAPTVMIGEVAPGGPPPTPAMIAALKDAIVQAVADPEIAFVATEVAATIQALQEAADTGSAMALIGDGGELNNADPADDAKQKERTDGWLEVAESATDKVPNHINYLPGDIEDYANVTVKAIQWFRSLPGTDAVHKLQILWLYSSTSLKALLKRGK